MEYTPNQLINIIGSIPEDLRSKEQIHLYSSSKRLLSNKAEDIKGLSYKKLLSVTRPIWTTTEDREQEMEMRDLSKSMSDKLGVGYSIDHIIPLRGKRVCGLNHHTNMRIIRGVDNIKKGNNY